MFTRRHYTDLQRRQPLKQCSEKRGERRRRRGCSLRDRLEGNNGPLHEGPRQDKRLPQLQTRSAKHLGKVNEAPRASPEGATIHNDECHEASADDYCGGDHTRHEQYDAAVSSPKTLQMRAGDTSK